MKITGRPIKEYEISKEGFLLFLFEQTDAFKNFYDALEPIYQYAIEFDTKHALEFENIVEKATQNLIKSIASADFIKIEF